MPITNLPDDSSTRGFLSGFFCTLVLAFMALSPVLDRSYVLTGLTIVATALVVIYKQRHRLPRPDRNLRWLYVLLLVNLLLGLLYFVIGRDSFDVVKNPLRLFCIIPVTLAIPLIGLRTKCLYPGLAFGMIATAAMVGYQFHVLELERPAAWYNPNVLSEIALVSGTLCLSACLLVSGWLRWFFICGVLGSIYCVLISETRGTLLAIVPMTVVATVVLFHFRQQVSLFIKLPSRKTLTLYLLAVLGVFTIFGLQFGDSIGQRFLTATNELKTYTEDPSRFSSLAVRLELWYSAWLSFKEAPLTGIGSDNRIQYLRDLDASGKIHLYDYDWKHTHSDYLDSLQRKGLPGMLLVLGLYWLLFRYFWQELKTDSRESFILALGGLLSIAAYATYSLTEVPLRNALSLIFFIVLISVLIGLLVQAKQEPA